MVGTTRRMMTWGVEALPPDCKSGYDSSNLWIPTNHKRFNKWNPLLNHCTNKWNHCYQKPIKWAPAVTVHVYTLKLCALWSFEVWQHIWWFHSIDTSHVHTCITHDLYDSIFVLYGSTFVLRWWAIFPRHTVVFVLIAGCEETILDTCKWK